MVKRDKSPRPRKVLVFDQALNDWKVHIPDDKMWTELKHQLSALSKDTDARLRAAIEKCVDRLATQRIEIQQGAAMASLVPKYEKLEVELARAASTWKNIQGGPSPVRTHFDGLEAMAREAKRHAAGFRAKKTKTVPVGQPWNEFVCGVAQCLREAGLNPTVNGRGYDEKSKSPSWFQRFLINFNAALPKILKEPAEADKALAKKIMRAMQAPK